MALTENMLLNPPSDDDVIVYESGEDTDTWDLQSEEFWRGEDESDLAESESDEAEEEATAIDREMDAYADRLREIDRQSQAGGELVLGDVEEYVYEPLQHSKGRTTIRLIHLQPSTNFDSPLVCTLSTTSIGHDGGDLPCHYEAMSYTWGSPVFSELLYIIPALPMRKSTSFMLFITQNLHDALKHLRRKDKDMILWVDAVCINQADTDEKDSQLGVMSKIFRYSFATHAWLGLDSPERDGEICLDWIEAIAKSTDDTPDDSSPFPLSFKDVTSFRLATAKFDEDIPRWIKIIDGIIHARGDPDYGFILHKFFDREYFKRRWTIQERYYAGVGVGMDMHCGTTTARWRPHEHGKALHRLQWWMAIKQVWDQQTINQVIAVIPVAEKYFSNGDDTVLSFMQRYVDAECADPRDKVLSLIDVVADEYHFPLMPAPTGYGSSIRDVYIAFSRALYANTIYSPGDIRHGSRQRVDNLESRLELLEIPLDILSAAGSMNQVAEANTNKEQIPSWVLDWRRKPTYDISGGFQSYYQQTTRERIQPFVSTHNGINGLCSNVVHFDDIERVFVDGLSTSNIEKHIRYLASMCVSNNIVPDAYQTRHAKEKLDSAQDRNPSHYMSWRWGFNGVPVEEVTALAQYSLSDSIVMVMNAIAKAFVLSWSKNYIESTSPGHVGLRLDRYKYIAEKEKAMAGRILYITKRGIVGVGPASSVAGDQIWMLTQSNSPFVLRPVKSPFSESGSGVLNEEEEWRKLGFSGQPCTASLIGAAHLFPSSDRDVTAIIEATETSDLCIL